MRNKMRPSKVFEDIVMDGGTITATCGFCGRFHFATHSEECFYEEGEVEGFKDLTEKDPEKYVEHPEDDSIGIGMIDGKQVVIGCPCDGLAKWEIWIWNNRNIIIRYIKERSEACRKNAEEEINKLDALV